GRQGEGSQAHARAAPRVGPQGRECSLGTPASAELISALLRQLGPPARGDLRLNPCLTMPNRSRIMVSMNKLSTERRAAVIAALVEGNSIRATVRMTGVAKNTVTKLLVDLGTVCSVYQDRLMRDLPCERIQCDEIWAFVGMKQKTA